MVYSALSLSSKNHTCSVERTLYREYTNRKIQKQIFLQKKSKIFTPIKYKGRCYGEKISFLGGFDTPIFSFDRFGY